MWVASVGGAVLRDTNRGHKADLYVVCEPRCHANNAFISLLANTSHNTATHIHNTIIATLLYGARATWYIQKIVVYLPFSVIVLLGLN